MTYLHPGATELVEITAKELSELVDNGKKIDHPATGSKDVADCLAGVTFTLMGDRAYRRNVTSLDTHRQYRQAVNASPNGYPTHRLDRGDRHLRAPLPGRRMK